MKTLIAVVLALLVWMVPGDAHAVVDPGLQNNGLQWRSGGKTPMITLYPIAPLSAQNVTAITDGARAWNDTGYVRYVVSPSIEASEFPYCKQCVAVRISQASIPFASISVSHGIITAATVYLLEGQSDFYANYTATHELGHVLGLGHSNQGAGSIMGTVIFAPACPQSADIEAVSTRYPYLKGNFTVPQGFVYPVGAVC